jgi:hypothetical protein
MEDISRELEREITQSKPTPYKQNRKKRVLILDDFGEMKSGGYLKVLVYIFLVISVICLFAATGFYYFFSNLNLENKQLRQKLTKLEKRLDYLIDEKEVLMARLVISGKELEIETQPDPAAKPSMLKENLTKEKLAKEKMAGIKEKPALMNRLVDQESLSDPVPSEFTPAGSNGEATENPIKEQEQPSVNADILDKQIITIEKFTVIRNGTDGDLEVRFDIRNLSDKPGGVSGRIFTILKPENKPQEHWLVVPASSLEKGVPSQYKKGQYFSIVHFKPVKFRIKNQAEPNLFKTAAIYIFNENGELMFESIIDITQAESS